MAKIEKQAKSKVDPSKYSAQVDWKKKSVPHLAIPQEEKVSSIEEIMRAKKLIPGPSDYKKTGQAHKIKGFYGIKEKRYTIIDVESSEKKGIPAPSKYESRGKSMADIIDEKAKKYMHQYSPTKTKSKKLSAVF